MVVRLITSKKAWKGNFLNCFFLSTIVDIRNSFDCS